MKEGSRNVISFGTGGAIGERCEDRPQLYHPAKDASGQDCAQFTPAGVQYYGRWFACYGHRLRQGMLLTQFCERLSRMRMHMCVLMDEQLVGLIDDMCSRLETGEHTPEEQARMRAFIAGDWERYFTTPEELQRACRKD